MSPWMTVVPATTILLAGVAADQGAPSSEGGRPGPAAPAVRVLDRMLSPPAPEAGEVAHETVVVWAPEGVRLRIADAGGAGPSVERFGAWRAVRVPDGAGVAWTFSAPLVAWAAGVRWGPALRVERVGPAGAVLTLRATRFEASSPLAGGADDGAPAPPEGPLDPGRRAWPGALGAVAAAALLAGFARSRRPVRAEPPEEGVAAPVEEGGPTVRDVLVGAAEEPAETAVRIADRLRAHPRSRAAGVRPALTAEEAARRLDDEALERALLLADAVKFGRYAPPAEEVLDVGRAAADALDRAGGRCRG
ncbi:MAG TPA: hypothetical protein VLH75_03135 [Longimicrobiales bacterium]|nr:hypothetical protein [Longimicrobiales bacterium]